MPSAYFFSNKAGKKAKTDAELKRSEAETATQTALGEKLRADSLATQAHQSAEEAQKQRNAAITALQKAKAERHGSKKIYGQRPADETDRRPPTGGIHARRSTETRTGEWGGIAGFEGVEKMIMFGDGALR